MASQFDSGMMASVFLLLDSYVEKNCKSDLRLFHFLNLLRSLLSLKSLLFGRQMKPTTDQSGFVTPFVCLHVEKSKPIVTTA